MRVLFRFIPVFCALSVALSGCGGGASSGSTSAGATTMSQSAAVMPNVVSISPTEKMMFVPAGASQGEVPAGTPPIFNAWVSLSGIVTGMPCANCAGNPPAAGSLGISFPEPYLPVKGSYEITYTFYNVSENKNSCTLTFNFLQGKTSLLHNSQPVTLNGNGQYVYFIGGPLPSNARKGPGTVNAGVSCNGFTPKPASQKIILH